MNKDKNFIIIYNYINKLLVFIFLTRNEINYFINLSFNDYIFRMLFKQKIFDEKISFK